MTQTRLRRIEPGDGPQLRELRLRALREDPEAFASSYVQEAERNDEAWEAWASAASIGNDQCLFVVEAGGKLVAMAGAFRRDSDPRSLHLIAMWTAPEWRRRGLGVELSEAVIGWARDADADELTLWVVDGNQPALETYQRAGFVLSDVRQAVPEDPSRMETLMRIELETTAGGLPPGYVEFAPMTSAEYDAYLEWSLANYAADLMEAEQLGRDEATRRAHDEILGLLPSAEATPAMHLATIRIGLADEPAGWIWFGPREANNDRVCVLYDIVVFGAFRGRGVGSAALDELEEWSRQQRLGAIALHVFEHNVGARRLYERLGYRVVRTEPGHVSMVKPLGEMPIAEA